MEWKACSDKNVGLQSSEPLPLTSSSSSSSSLLVGLPTAICFPIKWHFKYFIININHISFQEGEQQTKFEIWVAFLRPPQD